MLASTANTVTLSVVGFVLLVVVVVVWRVLMHDKAIRRIRFGVFYERERDDEYDYSEPPQRERKEGPDERA
jgi:hypothetical protein